MDKVRVKTGKPSKQFVYLPVYLGDKLERIVIQDRIQFTTEIKVGHSFVIRKRDNLKDILDGKDELKVDQVKHSFIDGSCMIILEKLVFKNKKELDEFVKQKRSIK